MTQTKDQKILVLEEAVLNIICAFNDRSAPKLNNLLKNQKQNLAVSSQFEVLRTYE
jgi:hypothetical protein